jgi:hypothetical protein
LSGAILSETNFINTNLSNSIIISSQYYESLKLNEKTNFVNAITNDTNFIYYISNFTENIPEIVDNKKELKLKLEQKILNKEYREFVLRISNLPEE